MKRLVVTGGSGFLGQAIVRRLKSEGYEVCSADRREGLDLRDGKAAIRFFQESRAEVVIHCAAHMGGIGYVREHGIEIYRDNLQISLGLLEGMAAAGIENLITIMPNCTYPGHKEVFVESEWWDGPLHDSVLMYGLPRKAFWGLCWTYGELGRLRSSHLVLPNLYGPHDHMDPLRSHALGAILARVVEAQRNSRRNITLWGSGQAIREWLYVEDAAAAVGRFVQAFAKDSAEVENHSLYNVGMGTGISIADLAVLVQRLAGWEGEFSFDSTQPEGAPKKVLDGSKFKALTGWQPEVPLDEGIRRTLQWYRKTQQNAGSPVRTGSGTAPLPDQKVCACS